MLKIKKMAPALGVAAALLGFAPAEAGMSEGGHGRGAEALVAGEPGDASRPSRRVEIVARELDGGMTFAPDRVEVKAGEQIEFVISNAGQLDHEFVVGDKAENAEHAAMMASMPEMKHADPNAVTVKPGGSARLIWKLSRRGTFEFACLVPGHYEAGMKGVIVVK